MKLTATLRLFWPLEDDKVDNADQHVLGSYGARHHGDGRLGFRTMIWAPIRLPDWSNLQTMFSLKKTVTRWHHLQIPWHDRLTDSNAPHQRKLKSSIKVISNHVMWQKFCIVYLVKTSMSQNAPLSFCRESAHFFPTIEDSKEDEKGDRKLTNKYRASQIYPVKIISSYVYGA